MNEDQVAMVGLVLCSALVFGWLAWVTGMLAYLSSLLTWSSFWWTLVAGIVCLVLRSASSASGSAKGSSQQHGAGGHTSSNGPQADQGASEEDEPNVDFGDSVRLKPHVLPGATGEIARILSARDFFAVMDVPRDSDAEKIKKAFRSKLLITHPDKNQGVVGALEASQRITVANETLSDEVRRKQYSFRLKDEEENGIRRPGMGNMAPDFKAAAEMFNEFCRASMGPPPPGATYPSVDPADYDPWGPAPDHKFHMPCSCGFDHIATKVPGRTSISARYCCCQQCGFLGMGTWLPARHDDVWFETPNNVLRMINPERFINAYRCVGNYVYDITDWCRCGGMLSDYAGNPAPTNTHYVPFRLQGRTPGSQNRPKAGKAREGSGYNEFKGGGANSHKNKKKKKGRR